MKWLLRIHWLSFSISASFALVNPFGTQWVLIDAHEKLLLQNLEFYQLCSNRIFKRLLLCMVLN